MKLQRYRDLTISRNTFSPKSRCVRTSPRKRPLASSILVRREVRQYKRVFSPLLLHPLNPLRIIYTTTEYRYSLAATIVMEAVKVIFQ